MTTAAYAYLLWDDYVAQEAISPQNIIHEAKQQILKRFNRLQNNYIKDNTDKRLVQEAYSLTNEEFKIIIEQKLNDSNSEYKILLDSVDAASEKLKELQIRVISAKEACAEVNNVVQLLDKIINQGNIGGKITQDNVKRIQGVQEEAKKIAQSFSSLSKTGRNIGKASIDKLAHLQGLMASTVAGYTLEIFLSLSYLTAYSYGIDEIDEKVLQSFINSGGKLNTSTLGKEYQDAVNQDIKKYSIDINQQTKTDTVMFFNMEPKNGTGHGELKILSESVQAKNYAKVSDIGLGNILTERTLSNLNNQGDKITDFFSEEFLVNAGSALGVNVKASEKKQKEILSIIKQKNIANGTTQNALVNQWNQIIKLASVLSAVDAISGQGMINGVQFYAIRSKELNGQAKIISTAEILEKVKQDIQNTLDTGVSHILTFSGLNNDKKSIRYILSDYNKDSFVVGVDRRTNKLQRSKKVWDFTIKEIMNTKIKIGLNASSWFA